MKSLKKKKKGFSLLELLISMAIFTIISVVMSNLVIYVAKFSLENERRTDMLAQLDNTANSIKNDLRGASQLELCASNDRLLRKDSNGQEFILIKDSNNLLVWYKGNCSTTSTSLTQANQEKVLTSADVSKVNKFALRKSQYGDNTLLYINIEVCDPDKITKKAFDCSVNPYNYLFAISTRKFQSS